MPHQSIARVRILVACVLAFVSLSVWAAFGGPYAAANWTPFTQTFGCGTSQVDTSGMPGTLTLKTITGCANISAGYTLTANIPETGTIVFDWSYASASVGGGTSASYTLAGVTTTLASGNTTASGTASIPVVAGQSFSLDLAGGTNATLTITNFFGPGGPAAVPALDVWGQIALAGLLGLAGVWAMRRQKR